MKATVLIDNVTKSGLISEWGLAILIEYNGYNVLLDTGASPKFAENAKALGIDLSKVDAGVLSHAHFDHADGMGAFFSVNDHAKFYLRDGAAENQYEKFWIFHKYIGIHKGFTSEFKDRIEYAKGNVEILPGVNLLPHSTKGLDAVGKRNHMYAKVNGRWHVDDFSHEQSLIFDTPKGVVVFNSCSHGGADNIIKEAQRAFPKKKIYALIGGFHLYQMAEADVRALAGRIKDTGIEKVYTGHCSGKKAIKILQEELGDMVQALYTGLEMEF